MESDTLYITWPGCTGYNINTVSLSCGSASAERNLLLYRDGNDKKSWLLIFINDSFSAVRY